MILSETGNKRNTKYLTVGRQWSNQVLFSSTHCSHILYTNYMRLIVYWNYCGINGGCNKSNKNFHNSTIKMRILFEWYNKPVRNRVMASSWSSSRSADSHLYFYSVYVYVFYIESMFATKYTLD